MLTRRSVNPSRGRGPEEGGLDAIRRNWRKLLVDQSGATAIEYGLIVAMIAIAIITSLEALGGGSNGMWTTISSKIVVATS